MKVLVVVIFLFIALFCVGRINELHDRIGGLERAANRAEAHLTSIEATLDRLGDKADKAAERSSASVALESLAKQEAVDCPKDQLPLPLPVPTPRANKRVFLKARPHG